MAKRKLYKDKYQKAIDHIIAKTEIEKMYLILESIFGIRVALP